MVNTGTPFPSLSAFQPAAAAANTVRMNVFNKPPILDDVKEWSRNGTGPDANKSFEDVAAAASNMNALQSRFQQKIRPMLDTVDRLRDLGVMEEGIALPTIVVVGDQSSGKSSVLESLAGISLPRGQGIATRVPLILRLQNSREEAITISYVGDREKKVEKRIKEDEIEEAVIAAQNELAGTSKGISNKPISLHIKKANAPDLTMVDLPGLTRVPVHGQPENIYEQIAEIIRHYISSPESVILNVLSAGVDFPTCESIRMSQQADKTGVRTLAVVTKVDRSPEGLLEKVTTDAVKIGLGYICVRNRVGDESHQDARAAEQELFATHLLLSKLDKRIVGIPSLADRLTQIQAEAVRRCLPGIVTELEKQLNQKRQDLAALPAGVEDKAQALRVFSKVTARRTEAVKKLVVRGDYNDCPAEDKLMHYPARLDEMFSDFNDKLRESGSDLMGHDKTDEILEMISECKGVNLANFLPADVFNILVRKQLDRISAPCEHLVEEVHSYAETVHLQVVKDSCEGYPALLSASQIAARNVIWQSREHCLQFVKRMLNKEEEVIFTKDNLYLDTVDAISDKLKAADRDEEGFDVDHIDDERDDDSDNEESKFKTDFVLRELGSKVDFREALARLRVPEGKAEYKKAWLMKVNLSAYWTVVRRRISDTLPHEIKYTLQKALVEEIHNNLLVHASNMDFDFESIMEEDSVLAQTRRRLNHSITVLRKALGTVFISLEKSKN